MTVVPNLDHRPLIGLTMGRDLAHDPTYARVRLSYVDALVEAGGLPVAIPPVRDASVVVDVLGRLDGILLTGGVDVDPDHFGEELHPKTKVDERRDEAELPAARWAIDQGLPVFGICRGLQVLNVACGGSLIQHLDGERQHHMQRGAREEPTHRIKVEASSLVARVMGATDVAVNSFHHQAVGELGRGLRAVGWSEDGTIEALEAPDHPWLLAVQFHPEDLVGRDEASRRLFSAFVAAARRRKEVVYLK